MAELTTLARPYAKAAFEVALFADNLQTWSQMLNLVAAVVSNEDVTEILSSPSLTGKQQADIVTGLCGDEINAEVQNFIALLAENKRLELLTEIVTLFESLKDNQEKTIEVDVLTAFPLADSTEKSIVEALKNRLQRDVSLRSEVDKSLLGGMIIRAGDLVIDGSVRGKLSKLAEAMKS